MTAPTVARSLRAICLDIVRTECGYCCAGPYEPCAYSRTGPDGYHLARFAQARRRGLLSAPDMAVALAMAGAVFTPASLVREGTS